MPTPDSGFAPFLKNGWTVREAANCAEALERVTHLPPPHLIFLDLTMPVMDGFAFLHRLRATPGVSAIPVIVLSARDVSAAAVMSVSPHVAMSCRKLANSRTKL